MGRGVAAACFEVEANGFGYCLAEGFLTCLTPFVVIYECHVGALAAFYYGLDERCDILSQSSEKWVDSGHREARFVEVEQGVVAQILVAQIVGLLPAHVDHLGEVVAEDREIVSRARLGPGDL